MALVCRILHLGVLVVVFIYMVKVSLMSNSSNKVLLGQNLKSMKGICTLDLSCTPVWAARPSCGCFLQQKYPDLSFKCLPAIAVTQTMSLVKARNNFYRHAMRKHVDCKKSKRYGNTTDGAWNVCTAGQFVVKHPCIVYSFGIREDWSFDDAIAIQEDCQVFAFDPSIGKGDHKRGNNIWFFKRGLAARTGMNEKGWNMFSLSDIIQELGHTNKSINYLKFDIEFSEWTVLENMIQGGALRNVKQIAFEIHAWRDTVKHYLYFWRILQSLENVGFQRWSVLTLNWNCYRTKEKARKYCPQANMAFINTNFLAIRQKLILYHVT